jgi:hypothetical protein
VSNHPASAVAVAIPDPGLISGLGDLLKWGVPGLALAVMLVCYISVHRLQSQALQGNVTAAVVAPFERLQRLFLFLSFAVFCVSLIVPSVVDWMFPNRKVKDTHTISFSISPTSFERDDLEPKFVVAGEGRPLILKLGTGRDTIAGDKTYTFVVERLVKEIQDLRFISAQQQQQLAQKVGGVDANVR